MKKANNGSGGGRWCALLIRIHNIGPMTHWFFKMYNSSQLGRREHNTFDCLIQRLRLFFLTTKQTVLRAPKDTSRLSPYNMRRGSRSPTGFPDSSWGGEGQGSSAGVVTHINCLRLTSSFIFFFFLFLSSSVTLWRTIEQYFFDRVTVSRFLFLFISICFTEMAYPFRCFCFGCWKRLIRFCSVILNLSRLCFLRRLWFAWLLVGLLFLLCSKNRYCFGRQSKTKCFIN